MNTKRLLRLAWAGALVGAASAFVYLGFAPIPRAYTTDRLLTIATGLAGAVIGVSIAMRFENRVRIHAPARLSARGATDLDARRPKMRLTA